MEQFTDDSSASLGLDHRVSYRSPAVERYTQKQAEDKIQYLTEIGVKNETDLLAVRPGNASDGEIERRMQKYLEAGYATVDALDMAEAEAADAPESGPGGLGASVVALMKPAVTPARHGGSKSGKRRHDSKPKKDGRGRPYVEYDEPREIRKTVCMTESTERAIDSTGVHRNDIMAAVGQAIMQGKTLAQILGNDILSEVNARAANKSHIKRDAA